MIARLVRRLKVLFRRDRHLDDLNEEMQLHMELRAAANRRRSLAGDDDDAAAQARRRFGNALRLREESGDVWGLALVDRIARDVRYGVRQLVKHPGWVATVVLTVAIGVGANASIFTLVDKLFFRPPPGISQPERLVWLTPQHLDYGEQASYVTYRAWRDRMTSFSGVLATSAADYAIGGGGLPAERVFGAIVSGNYFDVFGVQAARGRMLAPSDDEAPGAHAVAVISDRLWQRRYKSDPNITGSTISINGHPFTIVGVAPPGFVGLELGENAEIWTPIAMQATVLPSSGDLLTSTRSSWLQVVGRLRDDLTRDEAQAEAWALWSVKPPATTGVDGAAISIVPMRGGLSPSSQNDLLPVFVLISIVPVLVLLVACANAANVVLARHMARRKEIALLRALGATRGRVVGQLLIESLLLAMIASAVGMAVSFGLTALIAHFGELPADVAAVLSPDGRVFGVMLLLALGTTILFGLAPALTATNFALTPSLKEDGGTITGASRSRLRAAFVIVQAALSLVLVISAGLFTQSVTKALTVDPGFSTTGAVVLTYNTALQGYTRARGAAFDEDVLTRVSNLPGVTTAALTSSLPLSGRLVNDQVEGETPAPDGFNAVFVTVSPAYFDSMRIKVERGRAFTARDTRGSPPVAIVNETLAGRMWPGADPIGQRLRQFHSSDSWLEVVGVVQDSKYDSLSESQRGAFYQPLAQHHDSPMTVVARTDGDAGALLRPVLAAVSALDPNMPLSGPQTIDSTLRRAAEKLRAAAALLAVLGTLALLLAAVGIHGVTAHAASMRTREVGVRIALGARTQDIVGMFLREVIWVTGAGIVIGVMLSALASFALSSFLYGLTATDAFTFVGASLMLITVAAIATVVPARRAARIDPLRALRQE